MATTTPVNSNSLRTENPTAALRAAYDRLRGAYRVRGAIDFDTRMHVLGRLEQILLERKEDIAAAISRDFGHRSRHETLLAEIMTSVLGIRHTREHLHEWVKPEKRKVQWMTLPARNEIQFQALGVIGVIAPWNYPLYLAVGPLTAAIAAGNRVLIKPSEFTPQLAALMTDLFAEVFEPDMVSVVTGDFVVGEAFSKLPFDHLLFTGSTSVGKAVMRAAAENLTPVTLELGGKSPVIIDEDYSIEHAASRVIAGKLLNAGQTCIAPDYVLVPEGRLEQFLAACEKAVAKSFPTLRDNKDYTSVVNPRHYARLTRYVEQARARGVRMIEINPARESFDPSEHRMAPVLMVEPADDLDVMQDEIFGPILPVRTYRHLEDAIAFVNDRPRPLALYMFGNDKNRVQRVLEQTVSGGVCVNETMLHVMQDDLPFGGVGPSGMGHYHAREGFLTFSKAKPIFHQAKVNSAALVRPPYGFVVDTLLRTLFGR